VIRIPLSRGRAELDLKSATLSFVNSDGGRYCDFKLAPTIEYMDAQAVESPITFARKKGERHFIFESADSFTSKEIHLHIRPGGFVDYRVVAKAIAPNMRVRCMHYGQDAAGIENGSRHNIEESFLIAPDRYGTCIPKKGKVALRQGVLNWHYGKDNNFSHEAGRTIIPPYFVALRSATDWLGVGTMEIPWSEWGLNVLLKDGRAAIDWVYAGNLTIGESYAFPRIAFWATGDKHATGRAYIDRLFDDGLAKPNTAWEEWWSGPILCWFSDQIYQYQEDRKTQELVRGEVAMTELYCNDAFLEKCLNFLMEKAIPYKIIIIDYGWFVTCGEWRPHTQRFRTFKATIAKLQAMGKKVLLWYAPYFAAAQSLNMREHPETAARTPDGKPFERIRLLVERNYVLDWTHPATRELCKRDFEFMLGPDGLNADGLKIDCTHEATRIENIFHDPAWGTGEMAHFKAATFMYQAAKAIKPDCCVNTTSGNPLFNGTYDLHRIHDLLEYNTDAYEERAWAALFCRAGMSDLDDWPSNYFFTVRANLRKICYGVPSIYAVMKRGVGKKRQGSWGYTVTPTDDEFELLRAIYGMHVRVPVALKQKIEIDPFRKVFSRRYTDGKLNGFYAAKTLCGNQAAVVYEENAAHVVSIADVALAVPLPPGAQKVKLSVLNQKEKAKPVRDFEIVGDEMILQSKRCSGDVKYYRINYSLA
jgi:hypothetical protein